MKVEFHSFKTVILMILCSTLLLGQAAASDKVLMMATTTSTDNTGLLDYLMPEFEKDTGITVKWTATGTGKALKLGENCDVDVLMVHAPAAEKTFVGNGFGINRKQVMFNDFVIIGPEKDPAGIKGKSVKEALTAIQGSNSMFISRGDDSGTHKKELSLWKSADLPVPEKENWYLQTGQGMLATINVAQERNAYTMTDRGTYIKYKQSRGNDTALLVQVEGDGTLLNQYSVIAINPANCPKVQSDLAEAFTNWLISDRAQKLIGEFKLLGEPLFTPNASK